MISKWCKKPVSTLRNEQGNVLMLVGLMFLTLIMAVGVAVDMARAQILRQRISAALDAAGLAAAQTINTPGPGYTDSTAWANAEALRYFNANFPAGYLGSSNIQCCHVAATGNSTDSNGNTVVNNNSISLYATADQAPAFMQTFGVDKLSVRSDSHISQSNVIKEVVLVLDDSGSMTGDVSSGGHKIQALQSALTDSDGMINILFGSNDTVPNLFMGIVPFTGAVNVGGNVQATPGSWMDPTDPNKNMWPTSPNVAWGGCVTARGVSNVNTASSIGSGVSLDNSEDPPSTATFDEYFWSPNIPYYTYNTDPQWLGAFNSPSSFSNYSVTADANGYVNFNPWGLTSKYSTPAPGAKYVTYNSSTSTYQLTNITSYNLGANKALKVNQGPNVYCPPAISPMMSSANNIRNSINALTGTTPAGNTSINIGLAWGWRMVSPYWRGLWGTGVNGYGVMAANALPLDYNPQNAEKVVILMTDGTNFNPAGSYSAYDFIGKGLLAGQTDPELAANELDNRTLATCTAMKNQGIIIYTIGFGNNIPATSPPTPPTLLQRENPLLVDFDLLQKCATDPGKAYLAPTNTELKTAFTIIANELNNIRVSQ